MSLLAKRIGLIVVSAHLIFSCKEKEAVGLELPRDEVGVFYTDTLSLSTYANLNNHAIATHNQDYLYAGAYNDPLFGKVSAEAYTQLHQVTEMINTSAYTVDSVKMTLTYDYVYGTIEPQTIQVYQLSDTINPSIPYYSIHAPLATNTRVDQNIPFTVDPGKTTQTIKLTNDIGQDILTAIGTGKTNADFVNAYKGIALIPQTNDEGVILKIKIKEAATKIRVFCKTNATDTTSLYLTMSSIVGRFSRITSDRTGIPVLSSLVNTGDLANANGDVYLHAGLGIRTKIEFPTLSHFKNTLGNIVINKAELVLEVDAAEADLYDPVEFAYLQKLDTAGNVRQYLHTDGTYRDMVVQQDMFDINGTTANLVVAYNGTTKSYTFNISTYFNAMLYGLEENNGLNIMPSSSRVSRTFADAAKVKMKIHYTKVE